MPIELLSTLAESSVAFAGLSALSLIVVQLAGVRWRTDMTTGLWLILAWSLDAFIFSVLPLVLVEFDISHEVVVSVCSVLLGLSILVIAGGALLRDTRLLKRGGQAPFRTMIGAGGLAGVVGIWLILNGLLILPGRQHAWYVGGVFVLFLYAINPLVLIMLSVKEQE